MGMVGHFRQFIAHFAHLVRPLNNHLEGDASKLKAHKVVLSRKAKEAFNLLKQAFLKALVLKFFDYSKPFVLEMDASSGQPQGSFYSKKGRMKNAPCCLWELIIDQSWEKLPFGKAEFLGLKWAITNHFKEYLMYKLFIVWTDNNPLAYLFSTPNLNACWHWWVASLANFNFMIEYQCGKNNAVTDALSQVNESLSIREVKAILDETSIGCQDRAELPLLTAHWGEEEDMVQVSATHVPKEEMHVIDWVKAQNKDPIIQKTMEWMQSKKERSLQYYLGDDTPTSEGMGFISAQKSLVLINGKLYLNCKLKGEAKMMTVFIILKAHVRYRVPKYSSFSANYIYHIFLLGYPLRAGMTFGTGTCMTTTFLLEPVDHAF